MWYHYCITPISFLQSPNAANPLFFSTFWYAIMRKNVADSGGQKMNRNNGVAIAKRLFALRDFFYTHADSKHAVKFAEIRAFYYNNRFKDGTNNKMIYADLHALQNLGIKVRYDEKSKGWLLDNPLFHLYTSCRCQPSLLHPRPIDYE